MLNADDLGNRKPTQLLHKMQQLLGEKADAVDPSFLRQLFLQHLPSNVKMILALTAKGTHLQELAEMADSVMEVVSLSIATGNTPQALFYPLETQHWILFGVLDLIDEVKQEDEQAQ